MINANLIETDIVVSLTLIEDIIETVITITDTDPNGITPPVFAINVNTEIQESII